MSLRRRDRQPEVMDQPDLDAGEHRLALAGLERINRWTGSAGIVWAAIRRVKGQRLRVLDLASGAGDTPIRLWRRAQRAGVPMEVAGCDVSPRAVEFAKSRAAKVGAPVTFFRLDALADPLPDDYDVLTASFFSHHLDDDQAVALLRKMAAAARRQVVIHDLRRGLSGYLLAYFGTLLLSRSRVVHNDGPKSVAAAFSIAEVRDLAAAAGLSGAAVEARFPCRLLLTWERGSANRGHDGPGK